jgi:hypothetical protein
MRVDVRMAHREAHAMHAMEAAAEAEAPEKRRA